MSEPKYRDEEWLREQYWGNERATRDIADECGCSRTAVHSWMKRHGIERREPGSSVPDERLTDKEWLREQYWENRKSMVGIADECGCGKRTVHSWMKRHGIERRAGGRLSDERLRDGEWVREQYWENGKSLADIADECGCGDKTLRRWMDRHGIGRRDGGPYVVYERLTDKEWVREQYWENGKSLADIADECGCSESTVRKAMDRHGIERRDMSGSNNPKWNGGAAPYGLGWSPSKRRQVRERDGHRCQDCGTTQAEHKAEYDQKLHVHHLIKARDIDDPEERNAPENLITLCRDCHRRWERLSEAGIRPQIDGVTAD